MTERRSWLWLITMCAAVAGLTAMAMVADGADDTDDADDDTPDQAKVAEVKLGEKAPNFTRTDTKGTERSLSTYEGKIVVIEWFSPTCPYVERCYNTKTMQNAQARVKQLDKGVVWLAIDSRSGAAALTDNMWIDRFKLKHPILLDPRAEVARLYKAKTTPHMFVIDTKGVLRYHGALDNNEWGSMTGDDLTNYVVNAVEQIVNEETVSPDFVKPYGCALQYAP